MICRTIDEVIIQLNTIIEDCKVRQDKLGYFALLYRKVTLRVKFGISQKEFELNERMEKLDVMFANRYFEAYDAYRDNLPCSNSWKVAFDAANEKGHIILQHLLLGINAHINLDLGLAALDTCGEHELITIQKDFNDINAVLSELVEEVKHNMGSVSPVFKWLMPLAPKEEEIMINFSIQTARDGAWQFANELKGNGRDAACIQFRDSIISKLANGLRNPWTRLKWITGIIAFFEWRSVADNLTIMEEKLEKVV